MTDSPDGRRPESRTEYSYEAFGREFFETAVTKARVESALAGLTGNAIDFGPRHAGPANLASITAKGEIRAPSVSRQEHELIRFAVVIPIYLELTVRLAAHDHRFRAHLRAHLHLTARAKRPLHVFIDIPAPTEKDVEVDIEAQGLRASVLDVVADVDGELRRFVARYIGKEIDKPNIRAMRDIDVRERLDSGGPDKKRARDQGSATSRT